MKKIFFILSVLSSGALFSQSNSQKNELTFATYNVSMESDNYSPKGAMGKSEQILIYQLNSGHNT
ncbi:MAG: endonuclease/exonuclease/phosphatase family protein, partial [Flavobacterium nitrogenifigens]|nr:endonuclease/exonuclease/phosphatase family protein [Flavobacterium nitrogenifigens]